MTNHTMQDKLEEAGMTSSKVKEFSFADLTKRYEALTVRAVAECHLVTDLIGGLPGTRDSVRMFAKHQLKLDGDELDKAVERILQHEIPGVRTLLVPEGSELEEKEDKSVNLIRRDEHGPWLGNWMVKANAKAAASRIGLFVQTRGSKGDMAEMGLVKPYGISKFERVNEPDPDLYSYDRIYLRSKEGGPAPTEMQFFKGRVSSPQGSVSIVTLSEACLAGARFAFEYRFFNGNITDEDVADFFAAAMVIGLGSAKSFERGKFAIDRLTLERGTKIARGAKREKKELAIPKIDEQAEAALGVN